MINLPRKKQRDDAAGPGPGLFRYVETVEEEDCLPHSVNPQSLKVISEVLLYTRVL